jgi:chromosomal replication initiator protein
MSELWTTILPRLEGELPEQQVNTWLRPLQALEDGATLRLYAPNRYALDWVQAHAAERIRAMLGDCAARPCCRWRWARWRRPRTCAGG